MRNVAARLVVVPLSAVLLLTGCGRPGTAATVDGERITDAQVANLVEDLSQLTTSEITPSNALSSMVVAPTIIRVAAEADVAVSTEQAVGLLDSSAAQLQVEPWDYSSELVEYARLGLVSQALQVEPAISDQATAEIIELDVDMNPRFGSWDAGVLSPTSWPWLIPAGGADQLAPGLEAPAAPPQD